MDAQENKMIQLPSGEVALATRVTEPEKVRNSAGRPDLLVLQDTLALRTRGTPGALLCMSNSQRDYDRPCSEPVRAVSLWRVPDTTASPQERSSGEVRPLPVSVSAYALGSRPHINQWLTDEVQPLVPRDWPAETHRD
jgi:hypothetical protein